jgi:hypothetical protein|tara:strand:- start:297 stop:500 length:204 start_codon:yes stop_codon:yes gene_type:complete
MSSQYKENNFSTEKFKVYESTALNEKIRPNIDHLINRILIKRKQEKRNVLILGFAISITLILIFFNF